MDVVKKINNNAAICIDSEGREIVAIGTGIGYPPVPYTLESLERIQKTFYDVDPMYLDLLNHIPTEVFSVSAKLVEFYQNEANISMSPNIIFTLADHINFAMEREKNNLVIESPLSREVQHLYEMEYALGLKALHMIKKELGIRLSKAEASNIALHLLNAKSVATSYRQTVSSEEILEDLVEIIGKHFQIYIDKSSVNYSRFASHLEYLIKRGEKKTQIPLSNAMIYKSVVKEYADTYACVKKMNEYLSDVLDITLNEEETLYLILHVNRLCVREDCYRKGITPNTNE